MGWEKVKLKNVLKQYRFTTIVEDDIEYKQVTISKHNGVSFRGFKLGKEIGRKRQFRINLKEHPNTLMLVRQGVQDGSIGIAPASVDGCIATENMPMFNVENINIDFLKIVINSPYFNEELAKISTTGSAQKSIHEREILEIEIPFPDENEQLEFVQNHKILDDRGRKIKVELSNQLSLLKQLRQSFLSEAMQGKLVTAPSLPERAGGEAETGTQLLARIKAEKAQLVKDKKLKKDKELPPIKSAEIPFELPKDWVWCRLGEVAYITSGSTPSKDAFVENGIPYLKMYNLRKQKIDFFFKPQYIKEEVHNGQLKRCRAFPGDVIMNIVGPPLGKIAVIPEELTECNFNQAAVLIRPLYKQMNWFVFWYLNEMSAINSIDTKGVAGQANISVTQAQNIKIPFPPLSTQNQIVAKLDELMKTCDDLENSIKHSQSQNEQLLQQVLKEALEASIDIATDL